MDRRPPKARPELRQPRTAGLYDPAHEHDGCGVACLARLDGEPIHEVIERAISTLELLPDKTAATVRDSLLERFRKVPAPLRLSLSLDNGTEYRFRVRAITAAGLSEQSVLTDPVTPSA